MVDSYLDISKEGVFQSWNPRLVLLTKIGN